MQAIEARAFSRGVSAGELMRDASIAIAGEIVRLVGGPGRLVVFCGKGNNAGDVLAAACLLVRRGWSVEVRLSFREDELSALSRTHLEALRALPSGSEADLPPEFGVRPLVVLDGLLGIGAEGPPREPIAKAIRDINGLREQGGAFVVAADVPSGLDADTGEPGEPCVRADLTVTIGCAKRGLVADTAANFVGRLALAALPALGGDSAGATEASADELVTPAGLRALVPPRPYDSFKGTWGRVGILAGSPGFLGAARICSEAALRAGAGLVTLYAGEEIYPALATACAPEIMVKPVGKLTDLLNDPLDAIAVGPGLGSQHDLEILEIFDYSHAPAVFDADALNALARHPRALANAAGSRLLTPHPGEMARIFPECKSMTRAESAAAFAARYPHTLLLKGARTIIARGRDPLCYNTTGNPGMGSGGMGDALTGVCAALLARKLSSYDAARLGAWICGRSAEISVSRFGRSHESLTAGDVIGTLGAAFNEVRAGDWAGAE